MFARALVIAVFVAAPVAAAGIPPAGLVLGDGAEVVRDARPPAAASAGEILFPGDQITARQPVRILSCADRLLATLPAGATAAVTREGIQSDAWTERQTVQACFLPAAVKAPVGGPRRLGAMIIRSMGAPSSETRDDRLNALPAGERAALLADLNLLPASGPAAHVMRGALYQRHRLHYDAKQEFEDALKLWPQAGWLKPLIVSAEDAAQRAR